MKQTDRILLDGLRSKVLADIPQSHWEEIEKAVETAGDIRQVSGYARTIVLDAIEVAKASFATRSEAGRYAANMRWKGQGERTVGTQRGKGFDSPKMEELRVFIDEQEGLLQVMQDLGESKDKISQQERIISQAKQDLKSGKSSNKKPFLDLTDIDSKGNLESGSSKPASVEPAKTSKVKLGTVTRIKEGNLSAISRVIRQDLKAQNKKVPFGAEPYLRALDTMDNINEMYGADRGSMIVAYALSNLRSYKGPVAREVKAELNRRLKAKK